VLTSFYTFASTFAVVLIKLKMLDESSDPDLAEERYDPEDNLNAYGSPVFRPPDDININEIVEQQMLALFIL
jgi:hypothetical protein